MRLSLALSTLMLLCSCSGSSNSGNEPATPETQPLSGAFVNVWGEWKGVWQSSSGPSGHILAILGERGDGDVWGYAILRDHSCATRYKKLRNARRFGGSVRFEFDTFGGNGTYSFVGHLSGDILAGAYGVTGGPCAGDSGTWMTRRHQRLVNRKLPELPYWFFSAHQIFGGWASSPRWGAFPIGVVIQRGSTSNGVTPIRGAVVYDHPCEGLVGWYRPFYVGSLTAEGHISFEMFEGDFNEAGTEITGTFDLSTLPNCPDTGSFVLYDQWPSP